jgi:hypothetical protein
VTGYRLNDRGSNPSKRRDCSRIKWWDVTTHLHIVPRLKIRKALLPPALYTFMVLRRRETFYCKNYLKKPLINKTKYKEHNYYMEQDPFNLFLPFSRLAAA